MSSLTTLQLRIHEELYMPLVAAFLTQFRPSFLGSSWQAKRSQMSVEFSLRMGLYILAKAMQLWGLRFTMLAKQLVSYCLPARCKARDECSGTERMFFTSASRALPHKKIRRKKTPLPEMAACVSDVLCKKRNHLASKCYVVFMFFYASFPSLTRPNT